MFKRFISCVLICIFCSLPVGAAEQRILIHGDSLSAGFGIALSQSWPVLLEQRLKSSGSGYVVTNISISGETTAGGRTRLAGALAKFKPAVVVLALGANDGLRGLPVAAMKFNLATMVSQAKRSGARVLLVGMSLPPNYGAAYNREFESAFRDLARRERVALLPFLLEPIALEREAFQTDGLHPTAAVQPRILEHVWKALKPLLI